MDTKIELGFVVGFLTKSVTRACILFTVTGAVLFLLCIRDWIPLQKLLNGIIIIPDLMFVLYQTASLHVYRKGDEIAHVKEEFQHVLLFDSHFGI